MPKKPIKLNIILVDKKSKLKNLNKPITNNIVSLPTICIKLFIMLSNE